MEAKSMFIIFDFGHICLIPVCVPKFPRHWYFGLYTSMPHRKISECVLQGWLLSICWDKLGFSKIRLMIFQFQWNINGAWLVNWPTSFRPWVKELDSSLPSSLAFDNLYFNSGFSLHNFASLFTWNKTEVKEKNWRTENCNERTGLHKNCFCRNKVCISQAK